MTGDWTRAYRAGRHMSQDWFPDILTDDELRGIAIEALSQPQDSRPSEDFFLSMMSKEDDDTYLVPATYTEQELDDFIVGFRDWEILKRNEVADGKRYTGMHIFEPFARGRTIVYYMLGSQATIGERRNFAGPKSRISWILECIGVGEVESNEELDEFYEGPVSTWVVAE